MTVKEIVADYLKTNGFDGLCRENCGCGLDNLFPCEFDGDMFSGCEPAYKQPIKKNGGIYNYTFPPSEWYSTEKIK